MSVLANQQETSALLSHFGFNPVAQHPAGGHVCGFAGFLNAENRRALAIVAGTHRQIRQCPISQDEAQTMVAQLTQDGALPKDTSFRNLVGHLIVAFSSMYVESGIDAFHFAAVHIHPGSYQLAKGQVWRTQALHLAPRRKHNERVAHSSFPHMPPQKR